MINHIINILITSPSLDTANNVSGISNLTRLLVENNGDINYKLFIVGKKDSERRGIKWLFKQIIVLASFIKTISRKCISLVHLNMPLEKLSTIINSILALLCHLINKPYIIHIHGGIYSKNQNTPVLHKYLIKKSLKFSEKIITLGEEEKQFLYTHYNISNEKIFVLPNSVKIPTEDIVRMKSITNLELLYLGRIDKNKGLIEIVEALKNIPITLNFTFHIAGDGPDKEWFINKVSLFLKNRFIYHGVVNGESKAKLLSVSNVFLLPSYYEGLPYALLEAMSFGVVPIVTPVGSIPEIVKHNENGIIVMVKNNFEIESSIKLLSKNSNFINKLSINAYNTIKENYSIDNYIDKLNHIYLTCIKKKE